MEKYTKTELAEALRAVSSIIHKCEKAQEKFPNGTSHHTLLKNRLKAMYISESLIEEALGKEAFILFESFVNKTINWAIDEALINAVILIGSYVRGTQKEDSDIDLIIFTSDKQHYIDNPSVFNYFGEIERSNIEFYGECTSVRVWYKSGLEVEFGMVTLKWIDMPLDYGTQCVLSDGYKILIDKNEILLPVSSVIPERTK